VKVAAVDSVKICELRTGKVDGMPSLNSKPNSLIHTATSTNTQIHP